MTERKVLKCCYRNCSYETEWDFALKHHKRQHRMKTTSKLFNCLTATIETYKCEECHFETYVKASFLKHVKWGHEWELLNISNIESFNVKAYKCGMCDFHTFSELVLAKHEECCKVKKEAVSRTKESNVLMKHSTKSIEILNKISSKYNLRPHKRKWNFKNIAKLFLIGTEVKKHNRTIKKASDKTRRRKKILSQVKSQYNLRPHRIIRRDFETYSDVVLIKHRVFQVNRETQSDTGGGTKNGRKSHKTFLSNGSSKYNLRPERIIKPRSDMLFLMKHQTYRKTEENKSDSKRTASSNEKQDSSVKQNKIFMVDLTLEDYRIQYNKGVKYHRCKKCLFQTKYYQNLRRHFTGKHLSPEQMPWYACAHCSYKAKQESNLKKHMQVKHSNDNEIKSVKYEHFKQTERKLLKYERRKQTKKIIVNKPVNWLYCDKCLFKTRYKLDLKNHVNREHASRTKELSVCRKCTFTTFYYFNYLRHMERIHHEV